MWHAFWRAARAAPAKSLISWGRRIAPVLLLLPAAAISAAADAPASALTVHALDAAIAGGQPEIALGAGTFHLDHQLLVAGGISIVGQGAATTVLVPPAGKRAFLVKGEKAALALSGLTVEGGDVAAPGGAIYIESGALNLAGVVLESNRTSSRGGAIATSHSGCATVTI